MLGPLLYRLTERLRGSRVLAVLHEIELEPNRPPEEVRERQWSSTQALLAHAERHVPYYREMFSSLGIQSRDVRDFDDFAQLPILTKAIVREREDDLIAENLDRATLSRLNSGGSTGAPLTFWHDRDYLDASDAGVLRILRQAGWRPGDMMAFFWGWNDRLYAMPRWEFELRQWLRRSYQLDSFDASEAAFARWARTWDRIRPRVAFGYASTIARFAEYLLAMGRSVRPVRGVFTTAEKVYPEQRAVIERAFGAPVFDCYGSSEVRNIAAECPARRMHVNADFVVVETEYPAAHGESAPFLLTSLRSYGMPFIRYRNEDCGRLLDGHCDCGSGFPLLDLRIARLTDHFVFPGGRVVHGEYLTHLMYGAPGIASFQFHQTAEDHVTIWVVPAAGSDPAQRAAHLARVVTEVQRLGIGVRAEVRETEAIPLSAAGKHRFTRSDVAVPHDEARNPARAGAR